MARLKSKPGLQDWDGPNVPYLILHSPHRGIMSMPWQVVRCNTNDDEQELLFEGPRADAMAYLRNNWDSNNS